MQASIFFALPTDFPIGSKKIDTALQLHYLNVSHSETTSQIVNIWSRPHPFWVARGRPVSVSGKKYFQIGSLEKGLRALELLVEKEELSVSQMAAEMGINRSASHRFLATLKELGYAEKNPEGRYQATFRLFELGMKVANRFEIRRVAKPYLRELADKYNETVNLGYLDGIQVIHLDKVDSNEILRMDPGIGTPAPAYCTGLGKSILAFLPAEELERYLEKVTLQSFTPNTITSSDELRSELQQIHSRGFAVDNEELSIMLRCVAAPIIGYGDYPLFAISVSGPAPRMTDAVVEQIADDLGKLCVQLSARLGKSTA
jgi:IclR family transcriptional regulator, KDG regulon repressor